MKEKAILSKLLCKVVEFWNLLFLYLVYLVYFSFLFLFLLTDSKFEQYKCVCIRCVNISAWFCGIKTIYLLFYSLFPFARLSIMSNKINEINGVFRFLTSICIQETSSLPNANLYSIFCLFTFYCLSFMKFKSTAFRFIWKYVVWNAHIYILERNIHFLLKRQFFFCLVIVCSLCFNC